MRDASDIRDVFDEFVHDSIHAPRPGSATQITNRRRRRWNRGSNWMAVAAAATCAAILIAVVGWHPRAGNRQTSPASEITTYDSAVFEQTAGSSVHTWSNYRTAGGRPGELIKAGETVQVSCRVLGYKVQDGNEWWYRLSGKPWSGSFYGSADAFYNNGENTGQLKGTPYVDHRVPLCGN